MGAIGSHGKALALMVLMALALFGPMIFSPGLAFPAHTDSFPPWRNDLDPEARIAADATMNRTVTDKNFSFHPDNQVTAEAFRAGRLPLWNPHQMAGFPQLAMSLYGVFYPLNLPLFLFGPEGWYLPTTLVHYILAGFFTYLLLRRFGARPAAAAAGGIFFMACANMTGRFHYYMTVYPMAWAPLMLYLVDRFHRDRSRLALPGLAVLCAMIVLSGFQQVAQYVIYLCMGYSLFLAAEGRYRIRWLPGLATGALLSGVGLFAVSRFRPLTPDVIYVFTVLPGALGLLLAGKGIFRWTLASLPVALFLGAGVALCAGAARPGGRAHEAIGPIAPLPGYHDP